MAKNNKKNRYAILEKEIEISEKLANGEIQEMFLNCGKTRLLVDSFTANYINNLKERCPKRIIKFN